MTQRENNVREQNHYTQYKIQPIEFIANNHLDFMQGNCIKYLCRYKQKNGLEDLKKAQHYLEMLIELETRGFLEI